MSASDGPAERLAALERQRRWLLGLLCITLLLSAGAAATAGYVLANPPAVPSPGEPAPQVGIQPPPQPDRKRDEPVRTTRLVVVDEKGTPRLTLGVDAKWPTGTGA